MGNKAYFYKSIFSILGVMLLYSVIVFYYDPLQQLRNTDYGGGSGRLLYPGIAKNYEYNIAVIGTSTSQNILKSDIEDLTREKAINLSLSGSTAYEQRELMKLVVENGNVNTVIYGLDYFSYARGVTEARKPLQSYLYKKTLLSNLNYIFNQATLNKLTQSIKNGSDPIWRNKLGYWGDSFVYSRENTLTFNNSSQWGAQNIAVAKGFRKGYNEENLYQNLNKLLEIISDNSEKQFKIFFPPYASLFWSISDKYNEMEKLLNFKSEVKMKLAEYSNVEIYDFQENFIVTEELNNYKDVVHFNPEVSKLILESIYNKEKRFALIDFEQNQQEFSDRIQNENIKYKTILNDVLKNNGDEGGN